MVGIYNRFFCNETGQRIVKHLCYILCEVENCHNCFSSTADRASDSRLREPEFKPCGAMSNRGQMFLLYIAPVHSGV